MSTANWNNPLAKDFNPLAAMAGKSSAAARAGAKPVQVKAPPKLEVPLNPPTEFKNEFIKKMCLS